MLAFLCSQIAFAKQKSTGRVDDSKVYFSGRYFIGPDYTFKTFRADAHFEMLEKISTFTTDKIEVTFSCTFQYFLRPEDLKELHENYNLYYAPVVKNTANSAAKDRGSLLSIDQFVKDRTMVERALLTALRVSRILYIATSSAILQALLVRIQSFHSWFFSSPNCIRKRVSLSFKRNPFCVIYYIS